MLNKFGKDKKNFINIFISILILTVFSLLTLYSISNNPLSSNSPFIRQLTFIIFSLIIFSIVKDLKIKFIHDNSSIIYILSYILCFIPFLLPKVESTYRWIDFGFFYIQPSEFLKLTTVLIVAKFLSNHHLEVKESRIIIFPTLFTLLSCFIVLQQPDLGTAIIIFAPLIPMLLWSGVNTFTVFLMIAPFITIIAASNLVFFYLWAVVMFIIFLTFEVSLTKKTFLYFANIFAGLLTPIFWNSLAEYQKERILTFLNPDLDPMGSAYHIIQSITAIGSGGFWGKGWQLGSQTQLKFLPVQESDFILSVIAEELGFVGILILMIITFHFIKNLLDVAFKISDYFSSLVIIGFTSIFLSHVFINSAMTIGLLPVKGLPFPFISAGGSFLLLCYLMIGIITSISKN